MCHSHTASHLQPSDLFPQEKRSRQERMIYCNVLLQAVTAVPRAALTCSWSHQVCYPAPSNELHISMMSIPGIQEAL